MTTTFHKVNFKELFDKNANKPLAYKGRLIQLYDEFYLRGKRRKLKFILEKTNSSYLQGVDITINGSIIINGQEIEGGILLREDTLPTKKVMFEALSNDEKFKVRNVTIWKKSKNQIASSPEDGSAMIVQELPGGKGKRYICNDVLADDDFNDLIFRIEYVD